MDGLDFQEIKKSELENEFTIGAEYYGKKYVESISVVKRQKKTIPLGQMWILATDGDHGSPDYQESGVLYLLSECVKEGYIEKAKCRYITEAKNRELKRSCLHPGDIVVTKTGVYFGKSAVIPESIPEANTIAHVGKITLKSQYNPYYVSTFLNCKYGYCQLRRRGIKATRPEIKLVEFPDIVIPEFSDRLYSAVEASVRKANTLLELASGTMELSAKLIIDSLAVGSSYAERVSKALVSFKNSFQLTGRLDAEYYQLKYKNYEAAVFGASNGYTFVKNEFVPVKKSCPRTLDNYNYVEIGDIDVGTGSAFANTVANSMQVDRKYEQWKAITESDFVTLFIKTWFTFIAVLRELNPGVDVLTEDGMPRGDKPFLNAYKEGIMPIVQKNINTDDFAQELFAMYPISMRKVMDVFPQYFFQTFFQINREFSYEEKAIDLDKDGNLKERYQVNLHIVDKNILKFHLGISGQFRTTKYNESIKKEIDLRPIIREVVEKHRYQNLIINETQFMHDFYDAVMREISEKLRNYIDITLPKKGFNQTVTGRIKDACLRLDTALRLRFEYNYRYPHEVEPLAASNSYAIIYQVPFNGFGRLDRENIYATRRGEYSPLIATKAVDWFANYVYALRNALFHEIISPLDEEWQAIFQSAYLLLKQVSDICISCISQIEEFPQTQENAVFEYAEKHKSECFDSLADHVELLDFPKMVLSDWKVEKGKITLRGWFSATLKLQQGDAETIENGTGSITTKDKSFAFSITLDDDFKIAKDKETQKEIVEIKLQGA